jgi:hypothetical protein
MSTATLPQDGPDYINYVYKRLLNGPDDIMEARQ